MERRTVGTQEADTGKVRTAESPAADLNNPDLYINREISWLHFNERVLQEAENANLPLLERVKFLAIFANNLDEFFMIRVSGLRRQVSGGVMEVPADGMTPSQQLAAVREALSGQLARQAQCWSNDLLPKLGANGIRIVPYTDLHPKQRALLRRYFADEVFPVLTPLAFDPAHPFPHISNLSLNLAVVVKDPRTGDSFGRIKIGDAMPRFVPVPDEANVDRHEALGISQVMATSFVLSEEVVAANLDMLFPGLDIVAAYPFRITRDADLELKSDEASDLLTEISEQVEMRHWGSVVRLEIDERMPELVREVLLRNLELAPFQVYSFREPLSLADFMGLTRIDRADLKYPPFVPTLPLVLAKRESMFDVIRREPILLYHPYDSFMPVVDFIREAAADPNVLAIKQTLYRAGSNSPVVDALKEARQQGKQVAVLVELQARFDEENNIAWARALEDEGVHVVYGVMGLKTHAKLCLVVRREADGIRRYVHMATGNYNTVTSRIYTDLSYFSCDPEIGDDVSDLFNALTGYSRKQTYRKLLVAPGSMRAEIIRRIERETERHKQHGDGLIELKVNALVDKSCIQALYRASQAGVPIHLQVRGICCLRPGLPGVSETIRVTSIVGRFLEHARIFHFRNGGEDEVLLGSADLMPRNLDRRVESLFPIESPDLRRTIINDILRVHLRDNRQARELLADGTYVQIEASSEDERFSSQDWLIEHWRQDGARLEF
ncbi:MAG TPA: polyphosphate kinase 1 [Dehalococcoidia bacterium]|nr:polyphosphate kinase 1 [Dehalococcoidia bacterium]